MFGEFSLKCNFRVDYEKSYLKGLKARLESLPKNNKLPKEFFNHVTPMIFTAEGLTPHHSTRFSDGGFVVGKSNNFTDLVSFWNFRSINSSAFFLPIGNIERFEEYISFIKEKIAARGNSSTPKGQPDYFIYHSKENEDAAKEVQEKYFSKLLLPRITFRNSLYQAKENYFYFDDQPVQGNVDKDESGHFSVHFQLPNFEYTDRKRYFPSRFFVVSFSLEW